MGRHNENEHPRDNRHVGADRLHREREDIEEEDENQGQARDESGAGHRDGR